MRKQICFYLFAWPMNTSRFTYPKVQMCHLIQRDSIMHAERASESWKVLEVQDKIRYSKIEQIEAAEDIPCLGHGYIWSHVSPDSCLQVISFNSQQTVQQPLLFWDRSWCGVRAGSKIGNKMHWEAPALQIVDTIYPNKYIFGSKKVLPLFWFQIAKAFQATGNNMSTYGFEIYWLN